MAEEDFTTYTEYDLGAKITVTATKVTWALLSRDEDAYVYKDKGVEYFAGNFTIELTYRATGGAFNGTIILACWSLTNLVEDLRAIDVASGDYLALFTARTGAGVPQLILEECDGGSLTSSAYATLVANTSYYLKIVRDESAGTYGTLYCYIYSDPSRTVLVDTLTRTLHTSKKDFRYIFAVQTLDSNEAVITDSGYTEDLEVVYNATSTAAPSVTTQAVSAIATTTATGNGNVISLGVPVSTQHGHVWATFINPTVDSYDGITENGVPAATGAFTSSLTSLIQNTNYYCRAYVTSVIGTFYGATATFTTLASTTVVTTEAVTNISTTTALGNGSIDNNGGSAITQHGVCWGTSADPTTADSKTEEGATTTIGLFSSSMTALTANTLYHARVYAVNTTGTGYGADVTFTTLIVGTPIVLTRVTINIRATTATGVGNIVDLGGAAVTQHGHCWGTTVNPTTADSKTENGTGSEGAFASDITSLTDGTTYYVRAYATNSYGTAYGNNDIIYPTSVWGATRGQFTVLGEHIAYTSRTGKQRGLLGVEM